jgi:hypothetical protein
LALADHELSQYPLKAEEGESPDFMFTWSSGETIGLEISSATDEDVQRWIANDRAASTLMASQRGYAGDQLEKQWCDVVRATVEKKVAKLSKFEAAARHDLLIPDDTRMGAGDRRKALNLLFPWAHDLTREHSIIGTISIVASLDVLYDIGGEPRLFPYVTWSATKPHDAVFSDRAEHAGRATTAQAIKFHGQAKAPVYFMDAAGRLIKQTSDGRRFEIRLEEDGEEVAVQELSHG